jgi:hypothetical protein
MSDDRSGTTWNNEPQDRLAISPLDDDEEGVGTRQRVRDCD